MKKKKKKKPMQIGDVRTEEIEEKKGWEDNRVFLVGKKSREKLCVTDQRKE